MLHYALSELEALGDDLALDEDTSYLDEVPAPADTIPGENDNTGTKTQVWNDYSVSWIYCIEFLHRLFFLLFFLFFVLPMHLQNVLLIAHVIHSFSRKKKKLTKNKTFAHEKRSRSE